MTHVDVLIVGAGLSGVGAACHLRRELPDRDVVLLERRSRVGGTWDLFRYPGVRSDSDMFTLGYSFRPWTDDVTMAAGPAVRDYVEATAAEYGVLERIRFGHQVTRCVWDSATARWTVSFVVDGQPGELTCDFLWSCTGYYDHLTPYDAELPGLDRFEGPVVHPQAWPEALDLAGKRVLVVGSGATAMTLVPALLPPSGDAAYVTMLQRTPTYVLSVPARDPWARWLARLLPRRLAGRASRWRNIATQTGLLVLSKTRPGIVRRLVRADNVRRLPEGYDVARHFTPPYDPWDQRICIVPDGDLFAAIRSERADVVTATIDTFTATGVRVVDGPEIEADVVVTATGLTLLAFGGIDVVVDGQPLTLADHVAYQGLMLDGVPNFAFVVGYAQASWTLRADLVSEYVVRLLRAMERRGARTVTPVTADAMGKRPMLDLTSGYIQRSLDLFPQQGRRGPWRTSKTYLRDLFMLRHRPLKDDELRFEA